ncbi:hypothetical protein [Paenibacillus amylolyticus]|uniref:hypothetical protein n=1 Tax=Paenibacillus amylolyticus TaxID=1451 RepID=UPI003EB710B3
MKKQTLWMTIPVTTAVLLALTGCGGTNSNQSSTGSSSSTTAGEQTQAGSGNAVSSDSGNQGGSANTDSGNAGSSTAGKEGTDASNTKGSISHSKLSDTNEVVKAVRGELKMQSTVLPTSFPLSKDQYLGAVITCELLHSG